MIGTDRRVSEQIFHNHQAAQRAAAQVKLRFDDAEYLDHETWTRPAFARLGDVRGKRVLDYGCGHGMAAVVLARAGARVTAFDLSPGYVGETRARACANGVHVSCAVADGEQLPFADGCFDAVWGSAILHHLDLAKAGCELHRVLKPDGVAVFCEPWGGNPALAFARRYLPYPHKHRTPDERPLTHRDLQPLRRVFTLVELEGFQLFGMVRRLCGANRVVRVLDALDGCIQWSCPALRNWCRYVVIALRKV
jgi:SAM-dependent methyltransferase